MCSRMSSLKYIDGDKDNKSEQRERKFDLIIIELKCRTLATDTIFSNGYMQ